MARKRRMRLAWIRYQPDIDTALPWRVYPWIGWTPLAAFADLPAAHTWATEYTRRRLVSIETAAAFARSLAGTPYIWGGDR